MQKKRRPTIPIHELREFIGIVRRLRRECPWDREQTHQSLRHSLIEETYEAVEALDENNVDHLRHELGDLLLHVVMHATIAEESGEFTLRDLVRGIRAKLIRRHPHVFGTTTVKDATEVKRNWERLKMAEGRSSILDGVPRALPALQRAMRVQQRAAKVGFDWKKKEDVWKKVREEVEELRVSLRGGGTRRQEAEFGDLLFALVNYARFLGINPENALRRTVGEFSRRFRSIEVELRREGKDIHETTLEEMDELWNRAKTRRAKSRAQVA